MLKDLRIGVIGGGVVGSALARAHVEFVKEMRVFDIKKEKSTNHSLYDVIDGSDLIFICLPTSKRKRLPTDGPTNILGHDIRALCIFFSELSGIFLNKNFVLKSTVPIGFTKKIAEKYQLTNLVHSPEFLTSRCALHDAMNPSRNVIGVPWRRNSTCANLLGEFYMKRHPGVKIHLTFSNNSEAAKLMSNAYFATKVSLFNEFQHHCELNKDELGWHDIHSIMVSDPRIEVTHTQVPGNHGNYGFGGECLPKDLDQLRLDMGENAKILNAVADRNEKIDSKRHVQIKPNKVTVCAWCPDPANPSPEHHPNGQCMHLTNPENVKDNG